jgi:hypothetical protein
VDRRVAILNGFGRTLGDGVMGLTALRAALAAGAVYPDPVLFRLPGLPVVQRELYGAAAFATVDDLPWEYAAYGQPFPPATSFAHCLDLRDFAFDPAFRSVSMVDYFLTRLGVAPDRVASAAKRNVWLASAIQPVPPAIPPGYVLICPDASMALRSMPPPVVAAIQDWLGGNTQRPAVVQWQVASLAELCGQLAAAALVVSTDTATVHLADAFSRPCLAFFPTHDPAWRARDYPHCRPVRLAARGLDVSQEFARDAHDVAAANAAWFPHGEDVTWLFDALRGALAAAERSA